MNENAQPKEIDFKNEKTKKLIVEILLEAIQTNKCGIRDILSGLSSN